jgi:hypothetical protein
MSEQKKHLIAAGLTILMGFSALDSLNHHHYSDAFGAAIVAGLYPAFWFLFRSVRTCGGRKRGKRPEPCDMDTKGWLMGCRHHIYSGSFGGVVWQARARNGASQSEPADTTVMTRRRDGVSQRQEKKVRDAAEWITWCVAVVGGVVTILKNLKILG